MAGHLRQFQRRLAWLNDCQFRESCINQDKCYICNGSGTFYKTKKVVKRLQKKQPTKTSWQRLEQYIADSINEAKRQVGSGNKWFNPGDIITDVFIIDAKERTGEKSFTIQKDWLDKLYDESKVMGNRIPVLCFRFKNSETIYTIMSYENLLNIISMLEQYKLSMKNSKGDDRTDVKGEED